MSIITRFAPSPTGMLHIGGVRTAIFSYLYAKQHGGKFMLRIEDTDKERSTQQAVDVILNGMRLLGLNWDGDEVYQSKNEHLHREFALMLLKKGLAYYAYDTKDELEAMREMASADSRAFIYRQNKQSLIKKDGTDPVIRLNVKAVLGSGKVVVRDLVKGDVEFDVESVEDFILLRSDGTPTYMLAVVVDDINMGITHIIRGDDHLTNTPKQMLIYMAAGAKVPEFAHIPLIHDSEGKKLSKRKGAAAVEDYIKMGFLPAALLNYLVRLGWSCEQDFLSVDEMIKMFNLSKISLSPARFDIDKLLNVNLHYISKLSNNELLNLIKPQLELIKASPLNQTDINRLAKISTELKKSKTINEIVTMAQSYLTSVKLQYTQDATDLIKSKPEIVKKLGDFFASKTNIDNVDTQFKPLFDEFLTQNNLKFKDVGPLLRACLIGSTNSTALGEVFSCLGTNECVDRINKASNLFK